MKARFPVVLFSLPPSAKTLALAVMALLCVDGARAQSLRYETGGRMSAEGFASNAIVQVFASEDRRAWTLREEFRAHATATVPPNPARPVEFFRARQKPPAAAITLLSATQAVGRLYQFLGETSETLTNIWFVSSDATLTGVMTRSEFCVTNGRVRLKSGGWKSPHFDLHPGTNAFQLNFDDVNGHRLTTNMTIVCLPDPVPFRVLFPQDGGEVVGERAVLYGRVESLAHQVFLDTGSGRVRGRVNHEGLVYFTGLTVNPENAWLVTCETDSGVSSNWVRFTRSPVSVTYSSAWVSGGSLHPYRVSGTISDTNYLLRIEGRTITPGPTGIWGYEGLPPEHGILRIKLVPRGGFTPATEEGAEVGEQATPSNDMWYLTSHAFNEFLEFERYDNAGRRWLRQDGSAVKRGDCHLNTARFRYYNNTTICSASYVGSDSSLLLVEEAGPCNFSPARYYGYWAEIADYDDTRVHPGITKYDHMTRSASSGLEVYFAGVPGGSQRFWVTIGFDLYKITDRFEDETTNFEIVDGREVISSIGGLQGGQITFIANEASYAHITPTLAPLGNGWYECIPYLTKVPIPDPPGN